MISGGIGLSVSAENGWTAGGDLGVVKTDIAANATAIGSNATAINNNTTGVTANAGAISTNSAAIAANIAANDTETANNSANIGTNAADIGQLQTDLDAVESNGALGLAPYVTVVDDPTPINGLKGPHIFFQGVNVHIRNGAGATETGGAYAGLGNLIVGYNEDVDSNAIRTGFNNLVVGDEHTYTSYGGFVAGRNNFITGTHSSVSGGENNMADGAHSSISGGLHNLAWEMHSSVLGGASNEARAAFSSILGGQSNHTEPSAEWSTIIGGIGRVTSAPNEVR